VKFSPQFGTFRRILISFYVCLGVGGIRGLPLPLCGRRLSEDITFLAHMYVIVCLLSAFIEMATPGQLPTAVASPQEQSFFHISNRIVARLGVGKLSAFWRDFFYITLGIWWFVCFERYRDGHSWSASDSGGFSAGANLLLYLKTGRCFLGVGELSVKDSEPWGQERCWSGERFPNSNVKQTVLAVGG
jgi:hypothetical protein